MGPYTSYVRCCILRYVCTECRIGPSSQRDSFLFGERLQDNLESLQKISSHNKILKNTACTDQTIKAKRVPNSTLFVLLQQYRQKHHPWEKAHVLSSSHLKFSAEKLQCVHDDGDNGDGLKQTFRLVHLRDQMRSLEATQAKLLFSLIFVSQFWCSNLCHLTQR